MLEIQGKFGEAKIFTDNVISENGILKTKEDELKNRVNEMNKQYQFNLYLEHYA